MRFLPLARLAVLLSWGVDALAACGSPQSSREDVVSTGAADTVTGDAADTSCQVVLRHTTINFESRLGPQTDCSSGTCWVIVTVTFDLAMSQSLAESQAYVLYQGGASTAWVQSPAAEPLLGAPVGFRRYQVTLNTDTFTSGNGANTVSLIPFIAPYSGGRLFDHNRIADPVGAYQLVPSNNWTIADDATACAGTTPAGTLTATFATGWNDSSTGALVANGKLDISYDVYRMPQTLTCTTDGVDAFATESYVRFEPGGQVLEERVNGPTDSATGKVASLPLEYDVPAGATSAALWFQTSSDCGGQQWDSNFGQNYTFSTQ